MHGTLVKYHTNHEPTPVDAPAITGARQKAMDSCRLDYRDSLELAAGLSINGTRV